MSPQSLEDLSAQVASLRREYEETVQVVKVLDGLTMSLVEDNDSLIKLIAHKDRCITFLYENVKELQQALQEAVKR